MDRTGGLDLSAIARGIFGGVIATLLAAAIATLLLFMNAEPVGLVSIAAMVVAWLATFVAGFWAARQAGHAGVWHGAVTGLMLFCCLVLLGKLGFNTPLIPSGTVLRAIGAVAVGALGGVCAIIF